MSNTVFTVEELAQLIGKSAVTLKHIDEALTPDKRLLKKRNGGYDLVTFVRRYADYVAGKNRSEMLLRELAAIVGKSERRLQQINKELADDEKLLVKGDAGFDLATFVRGWTAYCVQKEKSDGELKLDDVRAKHELVKMEKTQLDLDVKRGELLNAEAVRALWSEIAVTVRNRFLYLGTAIAQELVMLDDPAEIRGIIEREVRAALEMLSVCKLPDMETAGESEEETEE